MATSIRGVKMEIPDLIFTYSDNRAFATICASFRYHLCFR